MNTQWWESLGFILEICHSQLPGTSILSQNLRSVLLSSLIAVFTVLIELRQKNLMALNFLVLIMANAYTMLTTCQALHELYMSFISIHDILTTALGSRYSCGLILQTKQLSYREVSILPKVAQSLSDRNGI